MIYNVIVDGAWSDWSDYGDCLVTCGKGHKTRSRECNSPLPANGGLNCTGESSEATECEEDACPGIFFDIPTVEKLNPSFYVKIIYSNVTI